MAGLMGGAQTEPGSLDQTADEDEAPGGPMLSESDSQDDEQYRNPQGRWALGGTLGLSSGTGGTLFIAGANLGYAVYTGILPGVRGLSILGDDVGGELATTLTLTPPVKWAFTPFVIAEGGRRWFAGQTGWLYGVGGGVYLGSTRQTFNFQLGYIFRFWARDGASTIGVGIPILGVTAQF